MRIFIPEYIIYFTEFDFSSLNLDSSLLQWVFRAKGKGNAIFIKDVDIQAHYFRV